MTVPHLTCDDAQWLVGDLLDGTLSDTDRARFDAHANGCAACRALVRDLTQLRDEAAALPTLTPSRDLWSGIEARLETPVVALSEHRRGLAARWTTRQVAAAAAALVAVTAGGTWMAATRTVDATSGTTVASTNGVRAPRAELVSVAAEQGIATYEGEIAKLRDVLSTRRSELDSATVAILEKNLTLIDQAIAESHAALKADPASTFLAGRLNRAYGTKLELLRSAAMLPSRT
jgi:hypothetical protein